MWLKFGNFSISMRNVITTSFYKDLTRKNYFFKGRSWFKFNNLGLALGINLKFYTSVPKGLKLKVRKFCGLIPTFVEGTGKKLVRGSLCLTFSLSCEEELESDKSLSIQHRNLQSTATEIFKTKINVPLSWDCIEILSSIKRVSVQS